jgi:alpha-tubulin suppressor-like RCC1 family protein
LFIETIHTDKSEIYSCGSNEKGQLALGHRVSQTTFQRVNDIESPLYNKRFCQMACSNCHSLLLTEDNQLWTTGFEVGTELAVKDRCFRFRQIIVPCANGFIKQISCGSLHSILLTYSGSVFTAGSNYYGELGLGNQKPTYSFCKADINQGFIDRISTMCVTNSTTILSQEHQILSAGTNDKYSLGFLDDKARMKFELVPFQSDQKIYFVSSGLHISVIVTDIPKPYSLIRANRFSDVDIVTVVDGYYNTEKISRDYCHQQRGRFLV